MEYQVKKLFKIETKNLFISPDFEQVYYYMDKLIEYDINVPELEGLGERLPYALNKIACNKIDRNDAITFFPIIWGKFEVYIKMLLYIIDIDTYNALATDHRNTLIEYAKGLGINIKRSSKERTSETDALYRTYKQRNADAHQCERMSMRELYSALSDALTSYLFVTKEKIVEIKDTISNNADLNTIISSNFKPISIDNSSIIKKTSFRPLWFKLFSDNIDLFAMGGQESKTFYKIDSWGTLRVSESQDFNDVDRIELFLSDDNSKLVRRNIYFKSHMEGSDFELLRYEIYSYNEDDKIEAIEKYSKQYGSKYRQSQPQFYLKEKIVFEYFPPEGYREMHYHSQSNFGSFKPDMEQKLVLKYIRNNDFSGRPLSIEDAQGRMVKEVKYSNDGVIQEVDQKNGKKLRFNYIGLNVFLEQYFGEESQGVLEHWIFDGQSGKLCEVKRYSQDNNGIIDSLSLKNHFIIY